MNLFRRQFLHLAAGALTLGTARAEDQTSVMKISGPTINDAPHLFMKNYAAAIQKTPVDASSLRFIPPAN